MATAKWLWLIRHGKAAPHAAFADDRERPLTKRGRTDAERMRAWMVAEHREVAPGLWLASPALRTRETAAILAGDSEVVTEPKLYAAWPEDYWRIVRAIPNEIDSIAIVAHNPTVGSIVNSLAGTAAAFPTLGTGLFRLPLGWVSPDRAETIVVSSPRQV